ncbi:MAG: MBOAT family protein, partial [Bacteroidales bacterium]|nr:MBOAT family protein [Bacteroidales bacterium]
FQIYFDFSGYSDMAIGLGRMFGFEILENFNFPYIAKSIREFWRRWHISLSNWFRDYLYIPLGGNRVSPAMVYFNLFVVFVLTGFWHGASWSFIVWGLIHGVFMILERIGFEKFLSKIWSPFRHLYVLLVVVVAWVFFRVENIGTAFHYTEAMFSFNFNEGKTEDLLKYLNSELIVVLILAFISSTRVFMIIEQFYLKMEGSLPEKSSSGIRLVLNVIGLAGLLLILLLSMTYLASGTYNPFIYFRF